jgi:Zn-dependent M28 family amino/carboxypeptidase
MLFLPQVIALALLQAAPASPPEALVAEVRTLSAAPDNDARFEALTALLRAHNLTFTVETFTLDKQPPREPRTRGRNVVVSMGEGPDQIVVGAHYDAARLMDGGLSRGAVDNGASSVMLVHAAEALRGQRLPTRVTFVWFDFEESGLLGSAKYLEAHASDRIKAMLNYDINGYGDTVVFGAPTGGRDPRLTRLLLETCAAEAVDCVRFDGMPPGDDRSFGRAKIPTLSIAILPATEVHQLWLMLHGKSAGLAPGFQPPVFHTIHTADDVLDKLDAAGMAMARRLAVALVRRLSEMRP